MPSKPAPSIVISTPFEISVLINSRVIEYIKSEDANDSTVAYLAAQGVELQHRLSDWHQLVQSQYSTQYTSYSHLIQDTELLISLAYFHALSVYISGIF